MKQLRQLPRQLPRQLQRQLLLQSAAVNGLLERIA